MTSENYNIPLFADILMINDGGNTAEHCGTLIHLLRITEIRSEVERGLSIMSFIIQQISTIFRIQQ